MLKLIGKSGRYYRIDFKTPLVHPGKFSTIYCGHDVDTNKKYTFKFLNDSINPAELLQLDNERILAVEDVCYWNEKTILVRQFFEGITLKYAINNRLIGAKKSVDQLKQIILAIGNCVAYLHENNILHLDIRPHNILINGIQNSNEMVDVRLIDLGMAVKLFEDKLEVNKFSMIYSPPEQVLFRNHLIDKRADVYSFAATIFELIFSKPIFKHQHPEVLKQMMLQMNPEYNRVGTKESYQLLLKGMSKKKFPQPFQYYNEEEIDDFLSQGIENRPTNIVLFANELVATIAQPKRFFWQ